MQAVVGVQVVLIVAGGWLMWQRPDLSRPLSAIAVVGLGAVILLGAHGTTVTLQATRAREALLDRVEKAEEITMRLEVDGLGLLRSAALAGEIPGSFARSLFSDHVEVRDLVSRGKTIEGKFDLVTTDWIVADSGRDVDGAELRLWRTLYDVVQLDAAEFSIESGELTGDSAQRFTSMMLFEGSGLSSSANLVHVEGRIEVGWSLEPAGSSGDSAWVVSSWDTDFVKSTEAPGPLFEETTERALPNSEVLARATRSLHEELVSRALGTPDFVVPHEHFTLHAFDRHPGIVATDFDSDGLDDLYVMARWGPNLLLRNRGDGTFEPASVGLEVEDHTAAAAFADFDNDGDVDAFLGCTLRRSQYMANEDGLFVDRSAELGLEGEEELPYLVASVAAADFDDNGLLDVYFSTYAARMLLEAVNAGRDFPGEEDGFDEFLPSWQQRKLLNMARRRRADLVRDAPGPPNRAFRNLGGGRFSAIAADHPLSNWRNTLQATWGDYDLDGDADLYLANDFAPNQLLRNAGDGRFGDVTAATGTADLGFGMGASWGDYDRDGWPDLYVSNMYSRAGSRITARVETERYASMARGNSLLRNLGSMFTRVSGTGPPTLPVERAGWGWGGQFADLDNDGFLDIYALSGFYTAPKSHALPEDV